MKHFVRFAVLFSMVTALSACGGGGNVETIATNGVSIAQFVGKWQNTNPYPACELDAVKNFYVSESTLVLTASTYSESYDYYSDAACSRYLGSSYSVFKAAWSLPTSAQTTNGAIRAKLFDLEYSVSGEILPPLITSDPSVSYKVLFYFDNNTLSSHFDVASPSLDDEGYPLGDSQPLFTYQAK
jgi:hypothetical protein